MTSISDNSIVDFLVLQQVFNSCKEQRWKDRGHQTMRYCPLIQLDRETILNSFQLWIYVVNVAEGLVYMCLTADCLLSSKM